MTDTAQNSALDFLSQFEVAAHVTRPVLKKKDGEALYVKFEGLIVKAKPNKGADKEDAKKEPPYIADVINLANKIPYTLIVNQVMRESLEEKYPDGGYLNKMFSITQESIEGKRYKTYQIAELKFKAPSQDAAKAAPKK